MDLMYLPESLSFQHRMFGWDSQGQNWTNANAKPAPKAVKKEKPACTVDERNCSICKQKQKRTLANYIKKARKDSDRDVCIEEEEEEPCAGAEGSDGQNKKA